MARSATSSLANVVAEARQTPIDPGDTAVTGSGMGQLSDAQRTTLGALADTFAPAARSPAAEAGDPHGFWARRASDLGVAAQLADRLEELLDDAALGELGKLLDALRLTGFRRLPQAGREAALRLLSATSADAREVVDGLRGLALQLFYGRSAPMAGTRTGPNWATPAPRGSIHPGPVCRSGHHPRATTRST
jgi:hypothetical protein